MRTFTAMGSRCRSSRADVDTLRSHLPLSIANFSSCSMFVGPLLPNSNHYGTVLLHMSYYCAIGKFSFSNAGNVFGISLPSAVEAYLGLTTEYTAIQRRNSHRP